MPPDAAGAVVPTRQAIVNFYGDGVPLAQGPDGVLYVPLRPLADFLGLNFGAQRNRVSRDRVLAPRLRQVRMAGADGRQRDLLCVPLDLLPGWLFGIDTSRVKPELVEKLDRYRAEAFRALWDAFKGDVLPAAPASGASGAALALEIAEAVAALARQQLAYEGRLGAVEGRQQVMGDYLRGYIAQNEQRVAALELHLSAGAVISEAQAAELAGHVKTVAHALEQRGTANGYQRVYSELYRRYRISGYKSLPAARFQEALAWLAGWYSELSGPATP